MEPPAKKAKSDKIKQTYKPSYTAKYPCIVKSRKDLGHVYCTLCKTDISIQASGLYDVTAHVKTAKHAKNASAASSTPSVMSSFHAKSDIEGFQSAITNAEVIMSELLAELNLPLAAADTLTKAFKKMFPDSKIAKNFQCGRTKATAIIRDLGQSHQANIYIRMRASPFTVSTDGSNDSGSGKQFSLVVRTFDPETKAVQSELLSIPTLSGSATGEAIYSLVDEAFTTHNVPWKNCIALGCDNAAVMTGKKKGVYAFVKEKSNQALMMGCTLHLVHLGAEKGAEALPVSASELLTDIFYYLRRSSLRKHKLEEFQWFHDVDREAFLKHVPTRWLSVASCLDRLMKNWQPLKSFFQVEQSETKAKSDSKVALILRRLKSATAKLYLLFLQYATGLFQTFLTEVQSGEPKIHVLRKYIHDLMRAILVNFVKPSAMIGHLPPDVDFHNDLNIKDCEHILVGEAALKFYKDKDSNLSSERLKEFYPTVVSYYRKVLDYLVKKLPHSDPLLKHIEVANIARRREDEMLGILAKLLEALPSLVPQDSSVDAVKAQFATLQCCDKEVSNCRMDMAWSELLTTEYDALARTMLNALTLPHSSAHCERIFSCIRHNKTEFRASLGDKTLEALMVIKHKPGSCLVANRGHSQKMLNWLKSSTTRALN